MSPWGIRPHHLKLLESLSNKWGKLNGVRGNTGSWRPDYVGKSIITSAIRKLLGKKTIGWWLAMLSCIFFALLTYKHPVHILY